MDYGKLLLSKGFSLNTYPEGKFWELIVESDEDLKVKLCEIFKASIDLFEDETDVGTIILQCAEDFTKCLFYYDCNDFEMGTDEFMERVSKI